MIARILNLSLAVALVTPLAAQSALNDTILRTSGQRDRGVEILEMTAANVKFKRGRDESTIPATEVLSVEWGGAPESYLLALAAHKRGEYTNAANLFAEAVKASQRDVFKAEAEYRAAEALVRAGGSAPTVAAEAVQKLNAWRSAHPDGWRLPAVLLDLARAQRLSGAAAEAEATLSQLEDTVVQQSLSQIWVARARLEKARVLSAQERVAEARSAYRSVGNTVRSLDAGGDAALATEIAEIGTAATVGEGETFIQEGEFRQGLDFFEQLTNDSRQPSAVRAAAYAGKGQALYLQAEAAGNGEGLRGAQLALARATLLDSLSGQTTAKAYYYMGKILLALGDRETSDYKARAFSYFESVAKHYSDTPWAARASSELKGG
jgi:TolA-binding protein